MKNLIRNIINSASVPSRPTSPDSLVLSGSPTPIGLLGSLDVMPENTLTHELSTKQMIERSQDLNWTSYSKEEDHKPSETAPSVYLRGLCPLCFPASLPPISVKCITTFSVLDSKHAELFIPFSKLSLSQYCVHGC